MNKAVYPGTFDPVTYGHIDLIKRGLTVFGCLNVAIAENPQKTPLFSIEQRGDMMKEATRGLNKVEISSFDSLIVDYARESGSNVIVRGLRMISDFEVELQMALTNRALCQEIETMFLMPNEIYSYLSSKLIKEIATYGGDVRKFVPGFVAEKLKQALDNGNG